MHYSFQYFKHYSRGIYIKKPKVFSIVYRVYLTWDSFDIFRLNSKAERKIVFEFKMSLSFCNFSYESHLFSVLFFA